MTDNSRKIPLESSQDSISMETIEAFLQVGGDINAIAENGYSLLMFSAKCGNEEVVSFLIERGADLNIKNNETFEGRSALMLAAENGWLTIMKLLIDAGATIDFVGENECSYPSALTLAAENGHLEIVELLIEKGAKIESTGGYPSALMGAAGKGHYAIVAFLINEGADVHFVDCFLYNALELAEIEGHNDIAQLLRAHGATAPFDNVEVEELVDDSDQVPSPTRKRKVPSPFLDEEELQGQPENKRAKVEVEGEVDIEAAILEVEADASEVQAQLGVSGEGSNANILVPEEPALHARTSLVTTIADNSCSFFQDPVGSTHSGAQANSPQHR